MKRTRCFALMIMLLLCSTLIIPPVVAADGVNNPQIIVFEDGSYVVISIEYDQPVSGNAFFANSNIKSGTKHYDYYTGSDKLALVFRVHGTFQYDGVTAEAIGASYSYDIYDTNLSFVSADACYSGATATATGSFIRLLVPKSITISLTCSPNGVLS